MKIKGTCTRCDRGFLVEQAIRNGGRCPWDGQPFEADYAAVLVDSLRDTESAGNTLENALEKIADLHPAFTLDLESVIGVLGQHIQRLERRAGR